MPEGPECKKFADYLTNNLKGKSMTSLEIISGRYLNNIPETLENFQLPKLLESVSTKGKFIYWKLSREPGEFKVENRFIWNTLGLTGGWTLDEHHKDIRIKFVFDKKFPVYFYDQRNFGTLKFGLTLEQTSVKMDSLGVDLLTPLANTFTPSIQDTFKIFNKSTNKNKTMAEILMNQGNYAGIGNYIKAEVLYRIKVSPWRLGKDISQEEKISLHQAILDVMVTSYSGNLKKVIYKQKISPCGNKIIAEDTEDGRTTWWVPAVQK